MVERYVENRVITWQVWIGHMSRSGKHCRQGRRRMGFKATHLPISVIFENLEYGSNIEEIMETTK
jgi:hypothetical protein